MSAEELGRNLAALLHGAWRNPAPQRAPGPYILRDLAPPLVVTGCAGLVWRCLEPAARSTAPASMLQEAHRFETVRAAAQDLDLLQALGRLRAAGIEALLVKGWAIAQLYPERGLRPSVDFDLCVAPADFDRAETLLAELPPSCTPVDLHAGYDECFDRTPEELFAASETAELSGVEIRIPCAEDHLRLLCLHFWSSGAWRPLWLVDVAVAVEARASGFDWERLLAGRARYSEWVGAALRLGAELLGASLEGVPDRALGAPLPGWLGRAVLRAWGSCLRPKPASLVEMVRRRAPLWRMARAAANHWPDPIRATVRREARFDNRPRLPLQLADLAARLPEFFGKVRER